MCKGNISVRFRHPSMDLTFLSTLLNLSCLRKWIAGTPRQTPTGEPLSGTYPVSYWVSRGFEFSCESGFGKQLALAINHLAKVNESLSDFKVSGGTIEIYLQLPGSKNNGDTIDSTLLKKMVDLGVDLLIEVFPGM